MQLPNGSTMVVQLKGCEGPPPHNCWQIKVNVCVCVRVRVCVCVCVCVCMYMCVQLMYAQSCMLTHPPPPGVPSAECDKWNVSKHMSRAVETCYAHTRSRKTPATWHTHTHTHTHTKSTTTLKVYTSVRGNDTSRPWGISQPVCAKMQNKNSFDIKVQC